MMLMMLMDEGLGVLSDMMGRPEDLMVLMVLVKPFFFNVAIIEIEAALLDFLCSLTELEPSGW